MGSTLTFEVSSSGSEVPLLSKEPLSLRLHQRGQKSCRLGWGPGRGGLVGGGWPHVQGSDGGASHLPRLPEEFTGMPGADTPGGRRAGGI